MPARIPSKHQRTASMAEGRKRAWATRYPVLFFVGGVGALMALYYAFSFTPYFVKHLHPFIIESNARLSSAILNLLGQDTMAKEDLLSSARFTISVRRGCDALEPMALLAACVIAFPSGLWLKAIGVVAGAVLLATLNLARIVSLFLIGVYWPGAFDIMHAEIWQVIFIALAILLWGFWMSWVLQSGARTARVSR